MWKKINNFVGARTIISAFLLTAFFTLLTTAGGLALMVNPNMEPKTGMPIFTAYQIVLAAIGILFMRKLYVLDESDFKFKNVGKGLLFGWIVFVFMIIIILTSFSSRSGYFVAPDPLFLLTVILFPLSTGLLEEVFCRGVVLKILLKKTDGTKKGIIGALIISAALFAAAHIIHLIWKNPIEVTGDFLFAMAGGMLLGAVYLRTKTLTAPILLHWFMNLSGGIFQAFTRPDYTVPQTTLADVIVLALIGALPLIIAALVLLRKVEPEEIAEK